MIRPVGDGQLGVAVGDVNTAIIHAERFRRDLRHGSAEALSHIRAGKRSVQVAVTLQNQPARTVIGENTLADAYILESRGHAPAEHLAALGILSFVFLDVFSQTFSHWLMVSIIPMAVF